LYFFLAFELQQHISESLILLPKQEDLIPHPLILSLDLAKIEISIPEPAQALKKRNDAMLDRGKQGKKSPLKIGRVVPFGDLERDQNQMKKNQPGQEDEFSSLSQEKRH
jgi:hypothetical protein